MFTSSCFLDQRKVSHIHTPTKIVHIFSSDFPNLFCVLTPYGSGSQVADMVKQLTSSWDLNVDPMEEEIASL